MRAQTLALGFCGLLAGAVALPVSAATTIWDFTASSPTCSSSGSSDGNSRNCSVGGITVTATAWANTGGASNTTLQPGIVNVFAGNGLGVNNADRSGGPGGGGDTDEGVVPEHAIDNDQRKDSILLVFSTPVQLTQIEIGYASGDSDMTVLAFTGGSCSSPAGQTYSGLTGCGWTFVRNLSNVPVDSFTSISNGSTSSQYWLIGTAISDVGGSTDSTSDHVKLLAVKGDTTTKVPEPTTLLLLGFAFAAAAYSRRPPGRANG